MTNTINSHDFGTTKPTFIVTFGTEHTPAADATAALKGVVKAVRTQGREPILYTDTMSYGQKDGNPLREAGIHVCNELHVPSKEWEQHADINQFPMYKNLGWQNIYKMPVIFVLMADEEFMSCPLVEVAFHYAHQVGAKVYMWSTFHHTWINGKGVKPWVRSVFTDIAKKVNHPYVPDAAKYEYALKRYLHLTEYSKDRLLMPKVAAKPVQKAMATC